MAKKKTRPVSKPTRRHKRAEAATPSEVMETMWDVLESCAKKLRRKHLHPMTCLATLTMGSLTAAKLLLRLQSDGQATYAGHPQVWERIEQMSDDLAAEEFETFVGEFKGAAIPGLRLKGERRYLHLVRNRTDFRWCPTSISGAEASPLDPEWTSVVPPLADELTFALINALAALRSSLPADEEAQRFHTLSETVALVALAKVHLAAWSNDKRAAALETIADMVSVQYLKDLVPRQSR